MTRDVCVRGQKCYSIHDVFARAAPMYLWVDSSVVTDCGMFSGYTPGDRDTTL